MLWRAEKATSTAEAGREAKLRRLQTQCQGRSGSLASTVGGGGGDQVGVDPSRRGLAQRVQGHAGEAEDLEEESPHLLEERRDDLCMGPPGEAGEGVAEAEAKLVGEVLHGSAACSKPVADLLGEQGLGPLRDGRQAEAALGQGGVKLIVS